MFSSLKKYLQIVCKLNYKPVVYFIKLFNYLSIDGLILFLQPIHNFVLHWLVVTLALEIYYQKRGIWGQGKGIPY